MVTKIWWQKLCCWLKVVDDLWTMVTEFQCWRHFLNVSATRLWKDSGHWSPTVAGQNSQKCHQHLMAVTRFASNTNRLQDPSPTSVWRKKWVKLRNCGFYIGDRAELLIDMGICHHYFCQQHRSKFVFAQARFREIKKSNLFKIGWKFGHYVIWTHYVV